MEKQKLEQIYDLCIDEWARYTLAGVRVSPELLSIITKLEEDRRNKDILKAMDRIKKSDPNIDLRSILDNTELYHNLLEATTVAAEVDENIATQHKK